jgi:hypothetical protein
MESFHFSSALDKHDAKQEEALTIRILEHLGITKEYLIYSNINLVNAASSAAISPAAASTLMTSLISNKHLALLLNQPHYYKNYASIPIEIKQYINGTYRIVYHSVQKRMRHEYSSEYKVDSYFNTIYTSLTARASYAAKVKQTPVAEDHAHHQNGHHNHHNKESTSRRNSDTFNQRPAVVATTTATSTAVTANHHKYENDVEDEDDFNESKSMKSSNGGAAEQQTNSIFVRLNSQPSSSVLAAKDTNVNNGALKSVNQNSIFVKYNANNLNGSSAAKTGQYLSADTASGNSARSSPSSQGSSGHAVATNNYGNMNGSSNKSALNRVGPATASRSNTKSTKNEQQNSKLCTVL